MILTTSPGKNGKIHIYVDGEYRATVDSDFWYSEKYRHLKNIDEEELTELLSTVSFRRAYNKGLDFLSRRLYGTKELEKKLCEKGHDKEAVKKAIARLKELRLLDDGEYANALARELYERKGYGKSRISRELQFRGIDREIVENALDTLDNDPQKRIILLVKKKYSNKLDDEKGRARTIQSLMRLGYSYSDIKSALNSIFEDKKDEFYE